MIYFLVLYIIFIVAYIGFSAAGIYHLLRFGYLGDLTKPAVWIYIFLSTAIILASFILIVTRNWTVEIGTFQ